MIEKIKKEAKERMVGIDSCHEWEHIERVYALVLHLGKKEKADLEILSLASILHDIARKEENDSNGKIDHAELGAVLARGILEEYKLENEKIEKICHCIETHRYRNDKEPKTLEAKILYDADKLDSIGAIGLGRAFAFAGHIGAKVHNKDVDVTKVEPYSIDDTAFREYEVKLKYIKDKMFTLEGKRIAKERIAFMEEFFKRLNKEVDGKI